MATGFGLVQKEKTEEDLDQIDEDEIEKISLIIDIIGEKCQIDYFQNLRLDQLSDNHMMRTNFVCQMGLLKQSKEGLGDQILVTTHAVKIQLYKLYLKVLNIHKTQFQMIQFFRTGEYDSRSAKLFLSEFRKSKIKIVELRPEAYIIMLQALVLQDNLSNITAESIKIEQYPNVLLLIDHITSHAWLINPAPTRLYAQMHRQNLYFLSMIKSLPSLQLP